ncbi:hypothetical protein EDD15DRAFT_2240255 [Pisolithus albus]|nr:hypothetical protein EDD15DRAFT_2240255 [Pisolithus albus]
MVVGSNAGIGFHLARMKPRSLLTTWKDEEKCAYPSPHSDEDPLRLRSYRPGDWHRSSCYVVPIECIGDDSTGITSMSLDFRSFDSAEARSHHGLNVLVTNAGTLVCADTFYCPRFQVDYPSMVLLSIPMLPYLVKASSSASPSLLQVMFVREPAGRLLSPTPVVACTVRTGFYRLNLFRGLDGKRYA